MVDIHRKVVDQVHNMGKEFLTQWSLQMSNATRDASKPSDESSRDWWVALAGNMLWAASCFVPGAGVIKTASEGMSTMGKVMYVTMAHGGAMAGAGVFATGPSGDPSGKDVLTRELNKKLKELQDVLHRNSEEWASSIERDPEFKKVLSSDTEETLLEFIDKSLWNSLFPSIPYQDYNVIYNGALQQLNKALAEFDKQYKAWKKAVEDRQRDMLSPGRMQAPVQWPYLPDPGPFKPNLVFDVPGAAHPRVIQAWFFKWRWTGTNYVPERLD
jgi:hypothetical protein